ncbi:hypothetical protein [Chitinophaga pinensis]|uniref:hypothetical protein n=1 Tax=Chitinophaga pinensis TaxID=79329 RepID=UPI0011D2687E|nr:hypothetical protein [Chitinophaga pinensis]
MIIPYPLKSGTPKVISGILRRIEIFQKNKLRYHFDGFVTDTYISIVLPSFYDIGHYKHDIEHVNAMTGIPVTLELIEKNGEHYLMKISYNDPLTKRQTVPLTQAEKSDLLNGAGIRMGCVGFFLLIGGVCYAAMKDFGKASLPGILIFCFIPFLLALLLYYIPRRQRIHSSHNKIVITTTIREVIGVVICAVSTDSSDRHVKKYGTGTGDLLEYYEAPLYPGDKVKLTYGEKNGKADWMISLELLP